MMIAQEQINTALSQLSVISQLSLGDTKDVPYSWAYNEGTDSFILTISPAEFLDMETIEHMERELVGALIEPDALGRAIAKKIDHTSSLPGQAGRIIIRTEDINFHELMACAEEDRATPLDSAPAFRPIEESDLALLEKMTFASHFPPQVTTGKWRIVDKGGDKVDRGGDKVARLVLKFPPDTNGTFLSGLEIQTELDNMIDGLGHSLRKAVLDLDGSPQALIFSYDPVWRSYNRLNAYNLDITAIDPDRFDKAIDEINKVIKRYGDDCKIIHEAILSQQNPLAR